MGYILKNTQSGRVLTSDQIFTHKDATMTGASYGNYSEFDDFTLIDDRTRPLVNFHTYGDYSSHPKYRAIYDSYSVSGAHLPSGASTGTAATGYGYNDAGTSGGGTVRTMMFQNAAINKVDGEINLQCAYRPLSLKNCGTASTVNLQKHNGYPTFFNLPLSTTSYQHSGQCYEFRNEDAVSGAVIPLQFEVEQIEFSKSFWGYSAATVSPYQYEVIFDLTPISHLLTTCTQIAVFDVPQNASGNKEELEWWLQFGYNSTNNTALQTINITSLSHINTHSSMSSFTTDVAKSDKTKTSCAILNSTCLNAIKTSTGNSLKLRVVANRIPNDAGVSSYNTYLTQYSKKIFIICFMF